MTATTLFTEKLCIYFLQPLFHFISKKNPWLAIFNLQMLNCTFGGNPKKDDKHCKQQNSPN